MNAIEVCRAAMRNLVAESHMCRIACAAATLSALTAAATVRHVDYENGADSGDATSAPSWKTLAYAVANADAGDEIVLAKGTHVMASDITVDKALSIHGAGEMDETTVDANHQNRWFPTSLSPAADVTQRARTIPSASRRVC